MARRLCRRGDQDPRWLGAAVKPPKLSEHFRLAIEQKQNEQDFYRARIAAIPHIAAADTITSLGWKGILEAMNGETYPPLDADRRYLLGLNWSETPTQRKLDRITDPDLRADIRYYNDIAEHTLRLKAKATFCERLGPFPGSAVTYSLWVQHATLERLRGETEALGLGEKAEFIDGLRTSWDAVSRLVVDDVPEGWGHPPGVPHGRPGGLGEPGRGSDAEGRAEPLGLPQ